MNLELCIKTAEQLGFDEKHTIKALLTHAKCCAEEARTAQGIDFGRVRELCRVSYECYMVAAFISDDLGFGTDAAIFLGKAGRYAKSCGHLKLSSQLSESSARMYAREGDFLHAGFAFLNAAATLLQKKNRIAYFSRIGSLIEQGRDHLAVVEDFFSRHYIYSVINAYERAVEEYHSAKREKATCVRQEVTAIS